MSIPNQYTGSPFAHCKTEVFSGCMDEFRHQKAEAIRKAGNVPYAANFSRTHTADEGKSAKDGANITTAGRVMLLRAMGKMIFATLQDHTGRVQIAWKADEIDAKSFTDVEELIDLGDFIGITGTHFTTQKGEPSVLVHEWKMLSKALRQPPEKWHGIADQETAWRQRYLDLTSNRETFDRFQFRSLFLRKLREFYWNSAFIEVETPVLVNSASGALATPFQTHHAAYDLNMFLRIAPETFLKECIVGGYDRVFEVARVFRNEGLDPSHLQDFTMVEHYAAYWDYEKNMEFTEQMLSTLMKELTGSTVIQIPDREGNLTEVDFTPPWPRITLAESVLHGCSIDIDECETADDLRKAIASKKLKLDIPTEKLGRGNLIDQLYKKVSRPKLVQPTFITKHPLDLSPLARRNDENPAVTDRFQLVVGGWEIVNAYSELIDPVDQAERFSAQAKAHAGGDSDAHRKDDEFVKALEYGCPPCSGWGMGVDRIVALLTQQTNLRDVVLFPLMKPLHATEEESATMSAPPTTPMTDTPLLEHADYGHLLPAAHGLIEAHSDNTKAHLLATGAAMAALAARFGGNTDTWRVAGMLHDLDWDSLDKDFERHCGEELSAMLATVDAPEELLGDIRSHYAHRFGEEYPLDTMLRKSLYCSDELTGFIIAVTLVRPSKSIADVEVKSVKKKLKDKSFAAQVDRDQIGKCEELLGIPLDEFIGLTLDAMKEIAGDLGL
ncbi:lysine--tRNA ligase [Candidatus Peregrinibacteria bacterium CG10_big_fil_rev_8_21_14_0_10_49_24]|nr:MAG: lysine--tRNA ligase [Candidatus Peregrinibacteria bacterium CG11_big_fil_rev_8_21_14_0_20_49_14]PIR51312.1 MAG: lysine--tRNA ligase [Candidatus Peregrinibacteria bacterium CG10_big_fil_rev_8_21_14_0_10_49_24]PJA67417.1 MAG: lysine--tRNA ligase [Candidatus Peregrinibacteria bacterium CG_4_9_14_3_um_filter_49_12]